MIPMMIVAGLVVGPVGLERRARPYGVLVAAVLALTWGALVAGIDGWSPDTFVSGTWLAVANLLVGALVSVAVALAVRTLQRSALRA